MSKRKSIICLSILAFIMVFLAVFSVINFQVGVYDYKSPIRQIKLGLDLKGGVYVTYEVDEESLEGLSASEVDAAITDTAKIMQDRLAQKGYTEAVVTAVDNTNGAKNIRVEIPDVDNADEVFDILAKPAKLEIRILSETGNIVTDASNISSAKAGYSSDDNTYGVYLTFNDKGLKELSKATTGLNYGTDKIYFILDGTVISSPTVSGAITGNPSFISGLPDIESAEALAVQINSGSYQLQFKEQIEYRVISATLGEEAIQTVLIAGIVSLVVIVAFMIIFYGMYGVAASLALFCYTILMILALAFIPFAQLTLPGIAGIILGIGMAVDANIIMFERIKDEYRSAKSFRSSYEDGFKRSLSAILDSNITTLIGGITLWALATGSVQGFAITLVFSVVISLFSAIVMTRLFVNLLMPITGEKPSLYKLKRLEDN